MKNLFESRVFGAPATQPQPLAEDQQVSVEQHGIADPEAKNDLGTPVVEEKVHLDAQMGVQKAEAVALLWTRTQLWIAYGFVFLVFFVVSMEEQIQNNLVYYVYSKFQLSPIVSTAGVVSQIVTGVFKLPLAKFIDLVGRAEGFAFMTLVATMGLVMMAACQNAETYAAAYVFYWVGFDGMSYVLNVFVADTTSLKNRGFIIAWTTTPYIATTFIGPPAAQSFIDTSGWRWGYGVFCIITPIIAIPIALIIFMNQRKALSQNLVVKQSSGRTLLQSIVYYFWEFDVIGLLLITGGFSLILLPFSLAAYQSKGWASGMIIAMLVIGFVCLCLFPVYEKWFSKKCFLPFELMANRTIMGACVLAALLDISFYMWDTYFYYYLEVVHGLSIRDTGYMTNIYSIGSCFWGVVVGIAIKKSGYFKWVAMFSLPLEMLGVGLMIHFREPGQNIGYIVMCQIFIAFGGGALVICNQMAVMASVSHKNVAGILAFLTLFSSIGSSIGLAVSSVIYEHTFPDALLEALPGHNATLANSLYASDALQMEYAFGTPERDACLVAWAHTQKILGIAGVAFLVPGLFMIAVWKNYKVSEMHQVSGRVI